MPVGIRQARLEEMSLLIALEDDAGTLFETCPGFEWVAEHGDSDTGRWSRAVRDGLCWVVVDEAGGLAGALAARRFRHDLFVVEAAVARAAQGQGHGRILFGAAEAFARNTGLDAVTLTTFRDVPWNAPAYRRRGYREITATAMPPYLDRLLDEEERAGLPRALRCAMELRLQV